jgi:NADH dehydrogenase
MGTKRIIVAGGGFAGLWSAVGAARRIDELGLAPGEIEVTLINRTAFHDIRVRNYESDLHGLRVPLDDVLGPIGVTLVVGEIDEIDLSGRSVSVNTVDGPCSFAYDRLVLATGSEVARPPLPGLAENAFDVDTFASAERLHHHLRSLPDRAGAPGRFTVLVVGAGLTGIEVAAEMPARIRGIQAVRGSSEPFRVILADRQPLIGSSMGADARPAIEEALQALGVEMMTGIRIAAIEPNGVRLEDGGEIPTQTVIWCAGMRASPLVKWLPVDPDRFGRVNVDRFMKVEGLSDVFAAGDVARALIDGEHESVMSCQHSRPMGRFAGHNVVNDLLGIPSLDLCIKEYVTILDLGAWGALYTHGWERSIVTVGPAAKTTKRTINKVRIYPPSSRNPGEILAAGAPVVQQPPATEQPGRD